LFNPFSIYISLLLFIGILTIYSSLNKMAVAITFESINLLLASFALIIAACVATIYSGNIDSYVILKYIRSSLYVFLFIIFVALANLDAKKIIDALSYCLIFHVVLVILQTIKPEIYHITSLVFGSIDANNSDFLSEYSSRKPGATSSFDTASILSLASLLLHYLKYKYSGNRYYILAIILSFIAALLSSRLGILISMTMMCLMLLGAVFRRIPSRTLIKLTSFLLVAFIIFILATIDEDPIYYLMAAQILFIGENAGYGTYGTYELLTGAFLEPLKVPLNNLIIGYGVDPGNFGTLPSDLGYVKQIYHVGIAGALLIIALHLYILLHFLRARKGANRFYDVVFYDFFAYLVVILLLFNYKSLEIYSRGIGDIVLFAYILSITVVRKS
jgi:hypothetical protein